MAIRDRIKELKPKMLNGHTCEEVIGALKQYHGMVAIAARKLRCSRQTIYTMIQNHPTVREALDEAREHMKDVAETSLFQHIIMGDAWAVCYYLKTQGRDRGYIERQEITTPTDQPIVIKVVYDD